MPQSPRQNFQKNSFYRDLGRAIRLARMAAGKTQEEVAAHIEVSAQQIQKYENGKNRLPVEQLVGIAAYLEVPVSRLLALPDRERDLLSLSDRLHANGFHTLLEGWAKIKDPSMRAAILNIVRRSAALSR